MLAKSWIYGVQFFLPTPFMVAFIITFTRANEQQQRKPKLREEEKEKNNRKFMMMTFLWIRLNKCTMCLILLASFISSTWFGMLWHLPFKFEILQWSMKNCQKIWLTWRFIYELMNEHTKRRGLLSMCHVSYGRIPAMSLCTLHCSRNGDFRLTYCYL